MSVSFPPVSLFSFFPSFLVVMFGLCGVKSEEVFLAFFFWIHDEKVFSREMKFLNFFNFPLITELKFLRNFFHLLILFSRWNMRNKRAKRNFGSGRKKKHFSLFTLEVDKRIFDVYVFIQFGVLLM